MVITEIMANPRAVADDHGEWIEIHNREAAAVDLRGWTIASGHDRDVTIDRRVTIPPRGYTVLARDADTRANGGVESGFAYGPGIALGNGGDWIALRDPDGRTADSVAWTSAPRGIAWQLRDADLPHASVGAAWSASTTPFGLGDLGTPGRANVATGTSRVAEAPGPVDRSTTRAVPSERARTGPVNLGDGGRDSTLVIRVLDVGQGDAILIENGGSRVLIDGGPDADRLARLLDSLGVARDTLDAVILTHQHSDHYTGLREVFRANGGVVRHFLENRDASASSSLSRVRTAAIARARRGELDYRDTDDPCANGAPWCSITMRGGARLVVLRPDPRGDGPNNRSVAVRLTAPDSSAFAMWLAGDAEQQEIAWFDSVGYDRSPGMRATVLKADHHGSCDGISDRYLALVRPEVAILSLAATNDYGYVHAQTLALLERHRVPWYRTDQNGTVTVTVPRHGRYRVTVQRGSANARGPRDRRARDCGETVLR